MAGRGPAPKGTRARERDQRRDEAQVTTVVDDGEIHGPELPAMEFFTGELPVSWPERTLDWWDTWRRSAQAQTFTDTDWSFLIDTAVMHAHFWLGDMKIAPELRLRVAKFGATPEDRARLRLEIQSPTPAKLATPRGSTRASKDRRDRVFDVVTGGKSA